MNVRRIDRPPARVKSVLILVAADQSAYNLSEASLEVPMDSFFSEIGIPAVDFVYIWAVFVTTMATFFGVKKKHVWLSHFMTGVFILVCLTTILFRHELNLRLFAALMLISVVTVEIAVTLIRKRSANNLS
jgi:hypothetical protein